MRCRYCKAKIFHPFGDTRFWVTREKVIKAEAEPMTPWGFCWESQLPSLSHSPEDDLVTIVREASGC